MPVAHPRKELVEALQGAVPASWRVVPSKRTLDLPNRTTVVVKQLAIVKTPEAPRGARSIEFVLTLVSRYLDADKAEDDLDSTTPDFLAILDQIRNLRWERAEQVVVEEKYLGVDVTVSVVTKKGQL
jgi:hypothetical protein